MKIELNNGSIIETIGNIEDNKRSKRGQEQLDDNLEYDLWYNVLILFKDDNSLKSCYNELKNKLDYILKATYSQDKFEVKFIDRIRIYGMTYDNFILEPCKYSSIYIDSRLELTTDDWDVIYPTILDSKNPSKHITYFKIEQ
jgi:hypothetical protein